MAEDDQIQHSDKVSEQPTEKTSENVAREATDGFDSLREMRQAANAEQKDMSRMLDKTRARSASMFLGRPSIESADGQVLVPGMNARNQSGSAFDALKQGEANAAPQQGDKGSRSSSDTAGYSEAANADAGSQTQEKSAAGNGEENVRTSDTRGNEASKELGELLKYVPDQIQGGDQQGAAAGKDTGWQRADGGDNTSGWVSMENQLTQQPSFSHDENGELNRVDNPDGSSIRREQGDPPTWRDYDKNGKATSDTYDNVYEQNGSVVKVKDDFTTAKHPDGSEETHADESSVYKNRDGQVTRTEDSADPPNSRSYSYEGNPPSLNKVENSDGTSIRKEAGDPPVWREYDKDGKATRNTYDGVDVDSDGSLRLDKGEETTFKHADGAQEEHTDKSVVYKNRDGQVTQTLDKTEQPPTGRSYSYEGNPPSLSKVQNSDGSTINREAGDPPVWSERDKDGKPTQNTYDDVDVHDNGALRLDKDGTSTFKNPDGSEDEHTDTSAVYRNREGLVTQTFDKTEQPPIGRSYSYEGSPARLSKVENQDGSSVRKEPGDPPVWRDYDKNGKPTRNTYDDVSIHDSGSLLLEKGNEATLKHPDGTGERHTDKSAVFTNRDGQVSQVLDKTEQPPTSRSYSYEGKPPSLSTVENPDGSTIRKGGGDPPVWREHDKDGNPTQKTYDKVSSDANGNLVTEKDGVKHTASLDGNVKVERPGQAPQIEHPNKSVTTMREDGTKATEYPDGRTVISNEKNQITQATYPNDTTRSFEYDRNGLSQVNNLSEGTQLTKGKDGVWREFDNGGNETGQSYKDVRVDDKGNVVRTPLDKSAGAVAERPADPEMEDGIDSSRKSPEQGRDAPAEGKKPLEQGKPGEMSEEDFRDFVRTGGFTKHDDPAKIENARDELVNNLRNKGSATDLDLRKIDGLSEVLSKSRKERGIKEPDIYERLGISKPDAGSKGQSPPAGRNEPTTGGGQSLPYQAPSGDQPVRLPTDKPGEDPGKAPSDFIRYDAGEGASDRAKDSTAGAPLPDPPNRETFLEKHKDAQLRPTPQEQAEYQKLREEYTGSVLQGEKLQRMKELEGKRMLSDGLEKIDKLPESERKKVYDSLDKILTDKSNRFSEGERKQFANELVNQIGSPANITQGEKNTCPPAVDEASLARNNPAKYAEHVASLVTEGKLLGKEVLSPDQVRQNDGEWRRSLTSKAFQTGVVNLALSDRNPPAEYLNGVPRAKVPPPPVEEIEKAPSGSPKYRSSSTGEWIKENGAWRPSAGLEGNEIVKIKNDLARDPSPDYSKHSSERMAADPNTDKYESKSISVDKDALKEGGESRKAELAKFERQLLEHGKKHGYPIQVSIGGDHTILVTEVEPLPGKPGEAVVKIQNTAQPRGSDKSEDLEWLGDKITRFVKPDNPNDSTTVQIIVPKAAAPKKGK